MSGIDWSKVKDNKIGAFVRSTDGETFFVETKENHFGLGQKGFIGLSDGREYHVFAHIWTWHERPSSPAWSGPQDGLPPVGFKCLLSGETEYIKPFHPEWAGTEVIIYANFKTERGTPLAAYASECGLRAGVGIARLFLPCRTPEQKAADEREAAIEEMRVAVGSRNNFPFAELYDAGYRKVEPQK